MKSVLIALVAVVVLALSAGSAEARGFVRVPVGRAFAPIVVQQPFVVRQRAFVVAPQPVFQQSLVVPVQSFSVGCGALLLGR